MEGEAGAARPQHPQRSPRRPPASPPVLGWEGGSGPFCGHRPRSCLPRQFFTGRAKARLPGLRAAGAQALLPEGLEAPVRGAPGLRAPSPAQLASPSVNSSLMDCLRDLQSGRSKPKSAHSSGPAAPAPPGPPRLGMVMV